MRALGTESHPTTSPTEQVIAVSAPNSTAGQPLAAVPLDTGRSWNRGLECGFPTRSPATWLPKRIELIDPDERFRDSIKEGFGRLTRGWSVEGHLNTNSAPPTLSKRPPDAILIDIKLRVNGGGSLRQLRLHMPEVPIVIITKNTGLSGLIESLAAGANGYLIKPLSACISS
jgi:CheY-like chemotaxis protein